jgi:hypothetical protein
VNGLAGRAACADRPAEKTAADLLVRMDDPSLEEFERSQRAFREWLKVAEMDFEAQMHLAFSIIHGRARSDPLRVRVANALLRMQELYIDNPTDQGKLDFEKEWIDLLIECKRQVQ